MKNKKKLIILIIAILVLVGILVIINCQRSQTSNQDALRLKKEYEALNNTVRESDGQNYNKVSIPKKNSIKYITATEAVDIIKNKTGIIYFGAAWCPWCRNAIEVLLEVAKEKKLETVYYVDMDQIRNVWEVRNQKLIKTQKEGKGYYELLSALDSVLGQETYQIKDNEGNLYDTKEKRIYMPFVISIKEGEIQKTHVGTVSLNKDQTKYSHLTKKQRKELKEIYNLLIDSIKQNQMCTGTNSCN